MVWSCDQRSSEECVDFWGFEDPAGQSQGSEECLDPSMLI